MNKNRCGPSNVIRIHLVSSAMFYYHKHALIIHSSTCVKHILCYGYLYLFVLTVHTILLANFSISELKLYY